MSKQMKREKKNTADSVFILLQMSSILVLSI